MRIAVFGCNGYIGKHLAYYFSGRGDDVTGFDMQDQHDLFNIKYRQLDIVDNVHIDSVVFDFDIICFFCGLTGTDISINKYKEFINVNEIGLLNLLDALHKQQSKAKIVFPSTRLVYKGIKNRPLNENSEYELKTIYATSKFNGERYLEMFRRLYGVNFTIYRICVPYGNVFDQTFSYGTIGFFLSRARDHESIVLYGDGDLRRSFTHIKDLCNQIMNTCLKPESNGEIYNIAGEELSLDEAAKLIASACNVSVGYGPWPEQSYILESGDTIFDSSKIASLLGNPLSVSFRNWVNSLKSEP